MCRVDAATASLFHSELTYTVRASPLSICEGEVDRETGGDDDDRLYSNSPRRIVDAAVVVPVTDEVTIGGKSAQ